MGRSGRLPAHGPLWRRGKKVSAARFLLDRAQERVAKRARQIAPRYRSSKLKAKAERLNARNYETVSAVTLGGDVVRVKVAKPNRVEGKRGANRLTRLAHGLDQRKATGSFWHPRPRTGVYKIAKRAFDDGRVIFKSAKADVTGKYVAGWFSVIEKDGDLVEDIQGDVIEMGDLRESAHEFVKMARVSKVMHDGEQIGDVVESVIIDDDFCKAHGITHTERGWWGAINVTDPDAQERVRKGELPAFSIGGGGKREPFHKRGQRARSLRSLRARFGE